MFSKSPLSRRYLGVIMPSLALLLTHTALAEEPMRVVGTNSRMANASYTVGASNTAFWQRTGHQLGGPVDEIDIAFMNWNVGYSGEVLNANSMTIDYAWLERASTSQVVPLTFSGSRELVMPADTATPYYMADPIASSVWTGDSPARDEVFWLHVKGSVPPNGKIYQGPYATYSGSKFIVYDPANDTGAKDYAGIVPAIPGKNQRINAIPLMFAGRYTEPGHLAVIGLGDSILYGYGDRANPTPVLAGNGFFNRAATNDDGEDTIAMLCLARSGESAKTFVNSHSMRGALLPFGNVVVEEYGTNDLGSTGGGDPATIYTRVQAIWQIARDAGVEKIVRTKLMPRTGSATHTWIDFADQTPNSGWGAGEKRDLFNSYLDTALAEGLIDVLADTLTPIADPTDDHYWLTNDTTDYATSDGTHPNAKGHELLTPSFRSVLESITVEQPGFSYFDWSESIEWNGADSTPESDPNNDGITNLLAYAMDLTPLATNTHTQLPATTVDRDSPDGPWLTFTYRESLGAKDLVYAIMASNDLSTASWTALTPNGTTVIADTLNEDPDGDSSAVLKRWRVQLSSLSPRFLKLDVTQ